MELICLFLSVPTHFHLMLCHYLPLPPPLPLSQSLSLSLSLCFFFFLRRSTLHLSPAGRLIPVPTRPVLFLPSGLCSWVCPITLISATYTWTSAAVRYAPPTDTHPSPPRTNAVSRPRHISPPLCRSLRLSQQLRSAGAGVIQELFPRVSCVGTLDVSDNGESHLCIYSQGKAGFNLAIGFSPPLPQEKSCSVTFKLSL